VSIKSLDASAIELELSYRVADVGHRTAAGNEILDLVYRHTRFAGLRLAAPPLSRIPAVNSPAGRAVSLLELVGSLSIFAALTPEDHEALAAAISIRTYRSGDVIVQQGETLKSLMIVRTGVVCRWRSEEGSDERELDRLAPGDVFGAAGLLAGMGETATLRALGRVTVFVVDREDLAPLVAGRPQLAEGLGAILASRMPTSVESDSGIHPTTRSRLAALKALGLSLTHVRPGTPKR
jgi:CRP-like cAMP-binding protein